MKRYLLFSIVFFLAAIVPAHWLISSAAEDRRSELDEATQMGVVQISPLPSGQVADVVYVLGGNQRSLELKYQAVAELFRQGVVDKIWILGRPGKTEYSPEFGRNITNDEWSLGELKKLGIPAEKVEIVKVSEGFFGTLSEAKQVSELARERNLKNILLITQLQHTRRTYISFMRYLPSTVTLYVQNASGTQARYATIFERIKLEIYKNWLISQVDVQQMKITSDQVVRV